MLASFVRKWENLSFTKSQPQSFIKLYHSVNVPRSPTLNNQAVTQKILFLGTCPAGWVNAGALGGCYLFSPTGAGIDWDEAVDYCQSNFDDSYLADILDQETQEFIEDQEILQSYPLVSYWIGGSDTETVSLKKIHRSM